jgi:hypothetical protein
LRLQNICVTVPGPPLTDAALNSEINDRFLGLRIRNGR